MYWPFLVLPYQRSPSRWNTFVSVLTQTMPGAGGGWYCAGADVEALEDAAGAFDAAGAPGGTGAEEDAVRPPDTVTIEEILLIVACGTPARDRSATDE